MLLEKFIKQLSPPRYLGISINQQSCPKIEIKSRSKQAWKALKNMKIFLTNSKIVQNNELSCSKCTHTENTDECWVFPSCTRVTSRFWNAWGDNEIFLTISDGKLNSDLRRSLGKTDLFRVAVSRAIIANWIVNIRRERVFFWNSGGDFRIKCLIYNLKFTVLSWSFWSSNCVENYFFLFVNIIHFLVRFFSVCYYRSSLVLCEWRRTFFVCRKQSSSGKFSNEMICCVR